MSAPACALLPAHLHEEAYAHDAQPVVFVPDETVTVVLTRLVMPLLITVHVVHCVTHCRQDNQVRHIRVLADANGFSIKYDHR